MVLLEAIFNKGSFPVKPLGCMGIEMESKLNHYKNWLEFLSETASFFRERGFLEVKTPTIVPSGAMESNLEAFKLQGEKGSLPTSPEFALKKLWLSGISPKIFEISPSFRDEENFGDLHLPEFHMLEFYIKEQGLVALSDIVKLFFTEVFKGDLPSKSLKLNELFCDFTGFKLSPGSDREFLKSVLNFHSIYYQEDYSWNDLYQLIYLNLIEPLICKDSLVFLENYPPQLAALAKINGDGWASRLEVYYKGVELGNGYDELLDRFEIERRWRLENEERLKAGREPHPVDRELLQITGESDLKAGVGIAIGLERLFSIVKKRPNIKTWPFEG